MRDLKSLLILAIIGTMVFNCSDDDDASTPIIPEELITNVNVIFTNANDPADVVILTAISADGVVDPTLNDNPPLAFTAGATYNATVTITDEINDENILEEIIDEKDEHFFVYVSNPDNLFTMERAANDEVRTDGERLGLNTTWTAGAAGTGMITVQLIHEPTSVNDDGGFGTAQGGEFDINNTWAVVVQ